MTAEGAGPGQPQLGFESDIKPLFREHDRSSMLRSFDLWSYDDVRTHASSIAEVLKDGKMPCDGAWPPEQVALFERWQAGGAAP
jgi:hypothetical protein